jgi:hypothetical protein
MVETPPREPMDTSPVFLWAALLVGLVIVGLVLARFLGSL